MGLTIGGVIVSGSGEFSRRMTKFPSVFEQAVGTKLHPGTINVRVQQPLGIEEEFRISGAEIDEPHQDLLFEKCMSMARLMMQCEFGRSLSKTGKVDTAMTYSRFHCPSVFQG